MNDSLTQNAAGVAAQPQDLQERIRRRAYELSQKRNGSGGDELTDWSQAEREILSETQQQGFDHDYVHGENPAEKKGVIVTDPVLSAG